MQDDEYYEFEREKKTTCEKVPNHDFSFCLQDDESSGLRIATNALNFSQPLTENLKVKPMDENDDLNRNPMHNFAMFPPSRRNSAAVLHPFYNDEPDKGDVDM